MTGGIPFASSLARLIPHLGPVSHAERLRACLGALIGLLLTGFVTRLALGSGTPLPWLVPPMGASAVLLFAVPASPLAQPWSILGGNTVAALVGITCARLIPDPIVAAALACAVAIGGMLVLRCLHPPSGAVALTAVLGGPVVHAAGYGFAVWPIGVSSVLLLATALAFNNLTGRRYPHLAPRRDGALPAGSQPHPRTGVTRADLEAVLRRHDEVVDIDVADLEALMHEAEARAHGRLFGTITCGQIMSTHVAAVPAETSIADAHALMLTHRLVALPVLGPDGALVGLATQKDFFRHARWQPREKLFGLVVQRSMRFDFEPRCVADIMTQDMRSASPQLPVAELALIMTQADLSELPITDERGHVVGIVTQSAMNSALFCGLGERAAA